MILYLALSIIIGYLLGSISPSWILGKILRGIDIRRVGTGNAGGSNTYKILGLWPAIITVIYDLGKGLLAIYIAWKLGIESPWYLLAGIAAFLGHIYPFYLRFRGGQGVATILAILFFLAVKLFLVVPIPWAQLAALAVVVLAILFVARRGEIISLFVIPLIWLTLIDISFAYPEFRINIFFMILIFFYIWSIAIRNIKKRNIVKLTEHTATQLRNWRTIARPLAVFIPIIYIYTSKEIILWIVGMVGAVFITADLVRLVNRGANLFLFKNVVGLFKEKEKFKFSSMTFFMLAGFLSILLFDKDIAIIALMFIIFGDLAVKFFGGQYSRRMIFKDRSLEGLLIYFAFSLFFGIFMGDQLGTIVWLPLIGAAVAAITDLFSIFGIDDNFTVALISGAVMQTIRFFS